MVFAYPDLVHLSPVLGAWLPNCLFVSSACLPLNGSQARARRAAHSVMERVAYCVNLRPVPSASPPLTGSGQPAVSLGQHAEVLVCARSAACTFATIGQRGKTVHSVMECTGTSAALAHLTHEQYWHMYYHAEHFCKAGTTGPTTSHRSQPGRALVSGARRQRGSVGWPEAWSTQRLPSHTIILPFLTR